LQFYTDIYTDISKRCLLNYKYINNKRKRNKNSFKIDPDVGYLKKHNEYKDIALLHQLANNLKKDEEISIDYPCDMIQTSQYEPKAYLNWLKYKKKRYQKVKCQTHKLPANYIYDCNTFIQKSYYNNILYANNNQYICTIQSEKEDFHSFKVEAKRLKKIWKNPNKIIGLGNMCRIFNINEFSDKVYRWIAKNMAGRRIHIYGMSLKHIKKYVPLLEKVGIQVSVDSTKWTKAVTTELKEKYGLNCKKNTRDLFFLEYIKEIEKHGIKVEY
jgi:hypothetical protein